MVMCYKCGVTLSVSIFWTTIQILVNAYINANLITSLPVTLVVLNEVLHHCIATPAYSMGESTTRAILHAGKNV